MSRPFARRIRSIPLLWKILLPPLVLTLLLGFSGGFLLVRNSTENAIAERDKALYFRATAAQAYVRDRGAALLDAARLTSSLERLPEAVRDGNAREANRVLAGVAAVHPDLDLVAVVDSAGVPLAGFVRSADSLAPLEPSALRPVDDKFRVVRHAGGDYVTVTAPLSDGPHRVLTGQAADRITANASERIDAQLALIGPDGNAVGSQTGALAQAAGLAKGTRSTTADLGGRRLQVMTADLRIDNFDGWRLAVAVGSAVEPAWASGARFAAILVVVLAAVIGFSVLSTRALLKQVRAVLATKRALGRGDLSVRAPVLADDELGELATGLNDMAEQLAASYEDLERQVTVRSAELARVYEAQANDAQARADFFRGLSHELRNPLAVIAANAEVLSDPELQLSTPGWREELGHTILQSARHMAARVDTVLEMARLDARPSELVLKRVALHTEVATIRKMMETLAVQAGVELAVDVPSSLPRVDAEPHRLHEIILNLVSNAAKYNRAGGRVTVSAKRTGDTVLVSVADTGRGIPMESRDQIFEPFYRVPGSEPRVGRSTGLGLSLTRRLVEAHGGTISVESEVGTGSTFCFTLSVSKSGSRRRSRQRVA